MLNAIKKESTENYFQYFPRFINLVQIYDYNESDKLQDYKQFCQSSTTSSENVRGRLDYWRSIIREL